MAVLGVSSITPAFPRVMDQLGVGPGQVGLLVTAFTLPGIALAPLLGVLADRWGRKRVLVPSLLLFAAAGTACAFAPDFSVLVALRFLQGVGAASLGALNVTLVGDLYEGRTRVAVFGYNGSVLSVGTALYPAIGGALALFGWQYPFLLPLLALPVAYLVAFRLRLPPGHAHGPLHVYLRGAWKALRNRHVVVLFLAIALTFVLLYGSYLTYFPIFAEDRFPVDTLTIGLIMATASLATIVSSASLGRLSTRFTGAALIRTGFLLYVLAFALVPWMPNAWALILPSLLFGAGNGINIPSILALLNEASPGPQRAAVLAVNGMVIRIGQTIGPTAMAAAVLLLGLDWPFYGGALLAGATLVLLLPFLASGPAPPTP